MATNSTVKFNVGGKLFEVSRDLIDKQSDTMLRKLVSDLVYEAWQEDPEVDRDGELFAHALNYLRYGSIDLPVTIPTSMFDREIDFYGIESIGDSINQESPSHVAESFRLLKSKHDMYFLALESYYQYEMKKVSHSKSGQVCVTNAHSLYQPSRIISEEERALFTTYLGAYFGLRLSLKSEVQGAGSAFSNDPKFSGSFYVIRED